jgi:hypothetical protein
MLGVTIIKGALVGSCTNEPKHVPHVIYVYAIQNCVASDGVLFCSY